MSNELRAQALVLGGLCSCAGSIGLTPTTVYVRSHVCVGVGGWVGGCGWVGAGVGWGPTHSPPLLTATSF
jgi:hypothetical protein